MRKVKPSKANILPAQSFPMSAEEALAWMGPAPLVPGEDPAQYKHVQDLVSKAMSPVDILDWFWVRDVTDLEWEVVRLRKIKAFMISQGKMTKFVTDEDGELTTQDGSIDENLAYAVRSGIDTLERVDRMIMTLELRRDRAYQECERRAAGSAASLRRATEHIEDAEFREVAPEGSLQNRAA
jgi:hypothetical protein